MNSKLRLAQTQLGASFAVLTIAMGYCLVQLPRLQDTAERADAQAGQLKPQVQILSENQQKLVDGLDQANRKLVALGEPPVPVPTVAPTPAPVQPDEFTAEEAHAVRQIVSEQLAQHKVTVTQAEISQIARTAAALVPKPADGQTPTDAQIRPAVVATVAAYCVGDKCVGPAGNDGERGPKGDKGDPAPKVTDEELLASSKLALAAYCGLESQPCKGPQGEPGAAVTGPPGADGAKGADGADGRSVVDMDCMDDGRWRITYDRALPNGEMTSYSRGPCRILVVDPTPTDPTPAAKKTR